MTVGRDLELIKIKCGQIALGHGACYVCGCRVAKKGMTVHHMWYLPNNEVYYKDFPETPAGRLQYYSALYPLVYKNPKRFMFLCNTCHHTLTRFCRFGDKKFKKLCEVRKMTLSHKTKIYISGGTSDNHESHKEKHL